MMPWRLILFMGAAVVALVAFGAGVLVGLLV